MVGNPPYVKLQNFRTVHTDMALFLREGRAGVGTKPYVSTQTGNFDLYLPFIEKGINLLNDEGRLGYIAPSLWTTNEYGEGLRKLISAGRNLDRWIDFKAFQVFEESTTYTALQFFTKKANRSIRVADAPTGEVPDRPWADVGQALRYGREQFGDRWLLLTGEERALIDRLYERCKRLDDRALTSNIFVGIQTSADAIYHLRRLGPGRYLCAPRGDDAPPPYEVEIEDAVMKPIISGQDAKRYVEPITDNYLLFPYYRSDDGVKLITAATMYSTFPKAWAYLRTYEVALREREGGKMNKDDWWWAYNYPKNLDKQEIVKIIVPRLVTRLACSVDQLASVYLDNVDVGGIEVTAEQESFFIAGILNAPVANFVFRRISKPFRGNYLSANKQFIAPLPIPPATEKERAIVASKATDLQAAHSARRDTLDKIARRLSTARTRNNAETWLFPGLKSKRDLIADAPARLDADKKREWAEQRYALDLATRHDAISARLVPGASLSASFNDGELSVAVDGVPIIDRIFVDAAEGEFVLAQWKLLAATFAISEKTDGKKLAMALRKLVVADNPALVQQIVSLEAELSALEAKIAGQEAEMNTLVYQLYGLTEGERQMVASG